MPDLEVHKLHQKSVGIVIEILEKHGWAAEQPDEGPDVIAKKQDYQSWPIEVEVSGEKIEEHLKAGIKFFITTKDSVPYIEKLLRGRAKLVDINNFEDEVRRR